LGVGSCLLISVTSAQTGSVTLSECSIPGVGGTVVCGSFEVPENRAKPTRKIPLNIVVLKATGSARQPDPIVPLQGGPGQAAVPLAGFYSRTLAPLREERDIVLIDVRGTGRSNPLPCDFTTKESLRSLDLLPPAAVTECRKAAEQHADPRQYTTAEITRDLEDVRRAMNIERWNVYGTSYGTRLGQEYLRRYPAAIRTATLKGVAAPSLAIPLPYARDWQGMLERTLSAGTRDQLVRVLSALRKQPATVTHDGMQVAISAGVFAEALRNQMYNPASVPAAIRIIESAANGDFAPAAQTIVRLRRAWSNDLSIGMFLSVTCAEDIPRIPSTGLDRFVSGTVLGDFRVRQQITACGLWPAAPPPSDTAKPVVSDVPVLLVSGDIDPVTPPRYGDEVVRTLRNGRHIVLKNHGHAMGPEAPCIVSIMKQFIDRGSAASLDVSCAR
jgi:pimeloyl-ACP methyl ester carboxylesterase